MTKRRKYLLFFGLFFLIFSPHLIVYGVIVKTVYIFVVIPGLLGLHAYFVNGYGSIVERRTLRFLFGILLYFVIYTGLYSFQDVTVVRQILTGFLTFFSGYYYVTTYKKFYGEHFVVKLLLDLNRVGIIHSIIVIITFISPSFKVFLYSFISITDLSDRYLFGDVQNERYQGIVHSGFSVLSVIHAALLLMGIWAYSLKSKKPRMIETIIFFLGQLTIILSILIIGRTGLLIILFFLAPLILYRIIDFSKDMKLSRRTIYLVITSSVIITILINIIDLDKYQKNLEFAFELPIAYSEYGELDRSSSGLIREHFFFPDNTLDLLFGTGNFGRSDSLPNIPSDVGYVLFIWGSGIFGMMVGFSFLLDGLMYAFKYRWLNLYLNRLIIVYILSFAILNLKEYTYFGYNGYFQLYFILICILGREIELKGDTSAYHTKEVSKNNMNI